MYYIYIFYYIYYYLALAEAPNAALNKRNYKFRQFLLISIQLQSIFNPNAYLARVGVN